MESGDPRTPLFASIGCVWPTVMALKYRAQSDNATGSMSQLNGDGLLLELLTTPPTHDATVWQYFSAAGDIEFITLVKTADPSDVLGYRMRIDVKVRGDTFTVIEDIRRPHEKCNVNQLIGNMVSRGPSEGETGDSFTMNQVEWNETMPPE